MVQPQPAAREAAWCERCVKLLLGGFTEPGYRTRKKTVPRPVQKKDQGVNRASFRMLGLGGQEAFRGCMDIFSF